MSTEHSKQRFERILDSINDGVFTVDKNWRITSFNKAAERITGVSRKDAVGMPCCEVFRASICECGCALRDTIETGCPTVNKQIEIMSVSGKPVPISISTAILFDEQGNTIGGVETFRDLTTVSELRKKLEEKYTFYDIITRNHQMRGLLGILPKVAESDSTCLIEGDSGTGKELFAHAIHNLSGRREKPFIAVNCGALPDTLLESELFGYRKGAFTDARQDKPGRFDLAEGGTIFLDEIGDVSPALQVKLLRVLQEKEYEPLGGTQSKKADVRVIAATNRNLETMIEQEQFRSDLFYRLNVVRLTIPPLRERKEDIELLAMHFINRLNRMRGKNIAGLSRDAVRAFMRYSWPGNIRELENAIETAFVLCSQGLIEPEHLPVHFQKKADGGIDSEGKTLEEIEIQIIRDTLQRNNYHKLATANELGINKTTLWRKIKKFNIPVP